MSNAASDPDESAERRFLALLAEVNSKIAKLTAEKQTLERLIIRERENRVRRFDVTRKNSLDRILVEDKICEIITKRDTHVYGKYIFNEVASILPGMKGSTFRSHLHRLKDKGIIKMSNKRGFWIRA